MSPEEENILVKTDTALTPVPGTGKSVSKREKYNWSTGGSKGFFHWIPKKDLNISKIYQRDQCSSEKVKEIARSWDWLLLGVLSVIRRADGVYWVFDGGHRTRASMYRDDVDVLPCMVHEVENVSAEAKAFVARNTMVSNVSAFDRHKASIVAEEPVSVKVASLTREFGLTLKKSALTADSISCIGALQSIVDEDYETARRSLEFCLSIAGDKPVSGKVLKAIFELQKRFKYRVDILSKYADKLSKHSLKEMEIKINQFSVECGGKGGAVIGAKAILELVNHRTSSGRMEW